LHGNNFNEAYQYALEYKKKTGGIFIHPYDDPDVIAGQGTIGMEIIRQLSYRNEKPYAIFVPVGGGGLIAGISAYVKYLDPKIKIIGVEAEDSACLAEALKYNKRTVLKKVGIFADGTAVKQIGKYTFDIAKKNVDEVITVNTDEICAAIKDLFINTRSIAEPSGALSIAGIIKYVYNNKITNKTILGVESGANVNFDRLRHISERTEIGEKTEALLGVTIPEKPGSFLKFCRSLTGHSITEFNYRYSDSKKAVVFAGIKLSDHEDKGKIISSLENKDYKVVDMTDNELAVLHVRHMVGGRCPKIKNEKIYRFAFPENPNALLNFLENMSINWNISMFHYRNHGAAFGRVFLGLQIPDSEKKELDQFLKKINYYFIPEDSNPAYKLFLE
ncbi:MAG: threonine ammonia-lyase, biosynthetic, partial [Victivallales bacterium]|nr:threonine ammonia-lyase, biosynthetic [Victivallales bacterium]